MERVCMLQSVHRVVVAAVIALGALGIGAPGSMAAGAGPWVPPPCPQVPGRPPDGDAVTGTWYRLDPILDATGTLSGQRLVIGTAAGWTGSLRLPPESFAAGPRDGRVLVGSDDGGESRVRLLDVVAGCEAPIAVEHAVVRSALLAPDGRWIYEHRVHRITRADLGVWRQPVTGGTAARVLPGLPADARFGPTFATDLRLGGDGRLIVSSCGMRACRIRILDPATGRVARVDGTGPALGTRGSSLVTMAPCAGFPCAIVATRLADGRATVLVERAGRAALAGDGGRLLLHEDATGVLRGMDLSTGDPFAVSGDGLVPVDSGSLAPGGVEAGDGLVILAPAGRVRDGRRIRLFDPATRSLVATQEVAQ
jgi:hypothetical protein